MHSPNSLLLLVLTIPHTQVPEDFRGAAELAGAHLSFLEGESNESNPIHSLDFRYVYALQGYGNMRAWVSIRFEAGVFFLRECLIFNEKVWLP